MLAEMNLLINPERAPGLIPLLIVESGYFSGRAGRIQSEFTERALESLIASMAFVNSFGNQVYNWNKIEAVLGQAYEKMSDLEWWALTQIYIGMPYTELARFLGLFAYRNESEAFYRFGPTGIDTWNFDQDKIYRLWSSVEAVAEANLQMQRELLNVCEVAGEALYEQRRIMLQRSAMASILKDATYIISEFGGGVSSRVLIGEVGGDMPGLSLERDQSGKYILSFNYVTRNVITNLSGHTDISSESSLPQSAGQRVIQISTAESCRYAGRILREMTGD